MDLKELILSIKEKIVEYSDLASAVKNAVRGSREPHIVIAFGKGAEPMARAAVSVLPRVEGGVVVVPEWMEASPVEGLELVRSSHPVPSEASIRAGEAVIEWARKPGRSRVLVLVSGGGSALVEYPQEGLDLEDIVEVNKLLLASGANIHEINTVRKHLSLIKGGWLARHAYPKSLQGLYASDVPGDRLDSIASGPTVPDPTTYKDALRVLARYDLLDKVSSRTRRVLEEGANGLRPETPKPGDPVFDRVENRLVAANIDVLRRLAGYLENLGFNTLILSSRLEGDSVEAGKILASIALEAATRGIPISRPGAILAGGETTVRIGSVETGRGGRNQELVLSFGLTIDKWIQQLGDSKLAILAMDTDGIDGSSPVAGAYLLVGDTLKARDKGLDVWEFLERHDSYTVLSKLDRTIVTGPLPSNLNSIVTIIIY